MTVDNSAEVAIRVPPLMRLRTMVKAADGRWNPEGQLWLVKYGAIDKGTLENYIHIDKSKNQSSDQSRVHNRK